MRITATYVVRVLFRFAVVIVYNTNGSVYHSLVLILIALLSKNERILSVLLHRRKPPMADLDLIKFVGAHPKYNLADIVESLEPELPGIVGDRHRDDIPVRKRIRALISEGKTVRQYLYSGLGKVCEHFSHLQPS